MVRQETQGWRVRGSVGLLCSSLLLRFLHGRQRFPGPADDLTQPAAAKTLEQAHL
ncbi:hypothetical protein G205_20272 [Arthrobacter nitrophenolicus]|uniref:Uncharacterized protein n=1 Tax=Arthrobacter nitrophenolicus TaxID=683150 RepID=L8TMM4_9MICC|nr:hypothetical protein G205_20272 [Arthrobacter nitrophenolicus]